MKGTAASSRRSRGRPGLVVGSAIAQEGAVVSGTLKVGEYPDGSPIESPVMIVTGTRPGPVLWVQALVHGQEIGGVLGIHRFLESRPEARLSGAVVFNLVTNVSAFRDGRRAALRDGLDLNRVFPGERLAGPSGQVAFAAYQAAAQCADAVLDLHSGGDDLLCCFHSLYGGGDEATLARSHALALACGAPRLWRAPYQSFNNSAFTAFARDGIPAVLVESGGSGLVGPQDVVNYAAAIEGACRWLTMSEAVQEPPALLAQGSKYVELRGTRGGIFTATVEPGQVVMAGDEIGFVTDIRGARTETLTCPLATAWVAAVRRSPSALYSGEMAAELIEQRLGGAS